VSSGALRRIWREADSCDGVGTVSLRARSFGTEVPQDDARGGDTFSQSSLPDSADERMWPRVQVDLSSDGFPDFAPSSLVRGGHPRPPAGGRGGVLLCSQESRKRSEGSARENRNRNPAERPGFTYSHSEGSRTIFKIQASRSVQYKEAAESSCMTSPSRCTGAIQPLRPNLRRRFRI